MNRKIVKWPSRNSERGRIRLSDREVVHRAEPGQTFKIGDREYLVAKNGSFRRLGPK